jgi:SAM-dependent methyltransferase
MEVPERHVKQANTPHDHLEAASWVVNHAHLVPPGGAVLDLACGSGRHVRLFRDLGHRVTALDKDLSRLDPDGGVERIEADLEDGSPWALPDRAFAGIVVVNYLYRPLFPKIIEALAPGGILIYQTFMIGNEAFGRPRNPDFLLQPGELREAFVPALEEIAFEEGRVDDPSPAIVQRLCCRKPAI